MNLMITKSLNLAQPVIITKPHNTGFLNFLRTKWPLSKLSEIDKAL